MKKQKILYIANGNNIHDIKWISYFSQQQDKFSCYLFCDTLCELSEQTLSALTKVNIHVTQQISPLSISKPIKSWKAIRKYKKLVKDLQPDLIHVLFATPNALWLNFSKTPGMITMRGSDILLVIPDLLKQSGLKKIYFGFLFGQFKKAFLNARVVTGTSLPQIDKANELFNGANITLVRTGVDVEKISKLDQSELIPASLRDKDFVFSPRFMSPIYNIEFQLEAISKLDQKFIEGYTFVFIRGKQFDKKYYQVQLKRLQQLKAEIKLNYLVIDYLDQPSMWMMLKKASLCIMTPISDGTPNSALEAMAAGCPLIVADLCYDKDLFDSTCVKTTLNNPKIFALLMEKTIENPNEFTKAANEAVYKFGNRATEMGKLEKLYNQLLSTTNH